MFGTPEFIHQSSTPSPGVPIAPAPRLRSGVGDGSGVAWNRAARSSPTGAWPGTEGGEGGSPAPSLVPTGGAVAEPNMGRAEAAGRRHGAGWGPSCGADDGRR